MAAKEETVFSFKKLLAIIICVFKPIKDRSKSVEITDNATSVVEKHGRAQVSAGVCRNEVDLFLPRAFTFRSVYVR